MGSYKTVFVTGMLVAVAAQAQVDSALYDQGLEIAAKHARAKKMRQVPGARLSVSAVQKLKLTGKYYAPGQRWVVKFTPTSDPAVAAMTRKVAMTAATATVSAEPVFYDFEVLEIAASGNARVRVKEKVAQGRSPQDGRIDHLVIELNQRYVPVKKEIYYRDGRRPILLELNPHNPLSLGFEAMPIDLPNLGEDDGIEIRDERGPGLKFETNDLLARPITVVWHEGEIWPSQVKLVSGTAELVR